MNSLLSAIVVLISSLSSFGSAVDLLGLAFRLWLAVVVLELSVATWESVLVTSKSDVVVIRSAVDSLGSVVV